MPENENPSVISFVFQDDGTYFNNRLPLVLLKQANRVKLNVDQSPDFKVVGAYPVGQIPDMKYGEHGERPKADENIENVSLPANYPAYGKTGPLMQRWR